MRIPLIFISIFIYAACTAPVENSKVNVDISSTPDTLSVYAPGIISTGHSQRDIAISKDGSEIFYSQSTPSNGFRTLIHMKLEGSEVITQEVASFSGNDHDIEPFFSPDQQRLYFASNRFTTDTDSLNDYNIWYVDRNENDWGNPVLLSDSINTPGNEFYPSVASNGNLYYTASYQRGLEFIWMSEWKDGQYGTPVKLDSGVNSSRYQFNAYVSPEEDLIVFSSYGRPDGYGGGDLYIATKGDDGSWNPARNLGESINSNKLDYCPFIDADRGAFYFTSNRASELEKPVSIESIDDYNKGTSNGMGSIYHIDLNKIK